MSTGNLSLLEKAIHPLNLPLFQNASREDGVPRYRPVSGVLTLAYRDPSSSQHIAPTHGKTKVLHLPCDTGLDSVSPETCSATSRPGCNTQTFVESNQPRYNASS